MSGQLHDLPTLPPYEEPPVSLNRSGGSQQNYTGGITRHKQAISDTVNILSHHMPEGTDKNTK
jgi:hypothetical protein